MTTVAVIAATWLTLDLAFVARCWWVTRTPWPGFNTPHVGHDADSLAALRIPVCVTCREVDAELGDRCLECAVRV
jgi:hypothetical protein